MAEVYKYDDCAKLLQYSYAFFKIYINSLLMLDLDYFS